MALLLLNGTAHEFVHSFAAHEDTIDISHSHKSGDVYFDTEHHHCDFLDLAIVAFDHAWPRVNFFLHPQHATNYAAYHCSVIYGKIHTQFGRGPPVFI